MILDDLYVMPDDWEYWGESEVEDTTSELTLGGTYSVNTFHEERTLRVYDGTTREEERTRKLYGFWLDLWFDLWGRPTTETYTTEVHNTKEVKVRQINVKMPSLNTLKFLQKV